MRRAFRSPPGARVLAGVWVALLALTATGIAVLAILGPPTQAPPRESAAPAGGVEPLVAQPAAAPAPQPASKPATVPGPRAPGSAVPDPDPGLLEASRLYPDGMLPRIATDGRKPMQVYAAGWDTSDKRPRVALLLAGLGLNEADSLDAIHVLPPAISLAVSPYAGHFATVVAAARAAGHETLVSIPMEPQAYPLNDAGPHALLSGLAPEQNLKQLDWALSRFAGYVGATGALENMRGERLAASANNFLAVQDQLAQRGLLYVDTRPGAAPLARVAGRAIDLVVDEPPARTDIEEKLFQLERVAHEHGSALGLAGPLRPVTVSQIGIWANGLYAHGILLVPVSALALAPGASR